jgi:hypothetical protein
LRKRSKQRDNHNHFFKNWLRWLTSLWKSLIKSLRILFTADLARESPMRSQRDEKLNDYSDPPISNPRPAPFLLGLENIDNLEFLTTKELIEQIEWNAESQEILTAKEEDLVLLEDLLVNFPET